MAVVAEKMSCPVDFPAVTALAVASGAIGRSCEVRITSSWPEPASLFLAMIAPPGWAKSPAMSLIKRVLIKIQTEQLALFNLELERRKAEKLPPPEAGPQRLLIDDVTVEAIVPILVDNPRGLAMIRDELSALFTGFNQYKSGKGSDRQFFLSAWSSTFYSADRKGNANRVPVFIPHVFVTIAGGIQPDMLSEMSEGRGRNDGLLDRFLFVAPDPVPVRLQREGVPGVLINDWEAAVRALWMAPTDFDREGKPRPHFVLFEPPALDFFEDWHNLHCEDAEGDDFPDHLKGPWSKMRAYVARFALILHRIGLAYHPGWDGGPSAIPIGAVRAAVDLIAFFKHHTEKTHEIVAGAHAVDPNGLAIAKWCRRTGRTSFSERDARRNYPRRFPEHTSALDDALAWLIRRHCIRPKIQEPRKGPGRTHSPVYEVNPALFEPSADDSPEEAVAEQPAPTPDDVERGEL